MDKAIFMGVGKRVAELKCDVECLVHGQVVPFLQYLSQAFAGYILHHDRGTSFNDLVAVNANDVGVL